MFNPVSSPRKEAIGARARQNSWGDRHVASRLRERRIVSGISQQKLAVALGLTFQQVYKYEQGKSRIGAGRLYEFAKALGVPVTFFFDGIDHTLNPPALLASGGYTDPLNRREAIELFTAYRAISNPAMRRGLRQLARALGSEQIRSTAPDPAPFPNRRVSRRVRIDRGRNRETDRFLPIL